MPNIYNYLTWRGDLSLEQSEFNEIDNLILARLSYFRLEDIMQEEESITIQEAATRFEEQEEIEVFEKEDRQLFKMLGQAPRFGQMQLAKFKNKIDEVEEKQFAAVSIVMPDDTIYLSYRGTDDTIVGWKEDFNMSFKGTVPSQITAVEYLKEVASTYPNAIRIGGHSKGGNLAAYAAIFAPTQLQERIIQVYNNDGPGFDDTIISKPEYKNMVSKIHTFVPQSSVVGRLLNHEEEYSVVQSLQTGIMQHDVYSWQVEGKKFIYLEEVTNGSQFVDKTIKDWLKEVSPEQRGQFLDIIFEVIGSTEAKTLTELKNKWYKNASIMIKNYKSMDKEGKEIIGKTIDALWKITKNNVLGRFSLPKLSLKKDKPKELANK